MLQPAKLSRSRCSFVTSGEPARTEPTNRLKPTMSKKNGSSVRPAKKEAPLAGSVVTVKAFALAFRVGSVVGAVNVLPFGNFMVAVCGVLREVCGENVMSMVCSAVVPPWFSISNRNVTSGAKKLRFSISDGTTNPSTSIARITFELSLGSRKANTSAISAPGSAATSVASAWSAAVTEGVVGNASDTLATTASTMLIPLRKLFGISNIQFLLSDCIKLRASQVRRSVAVQDFFESWPVHPMALNRESVKEDQEW